MQADQIRAIWRRINARDDHPDAAVPENEVLTVAAEELDGILGSIEVVDFDGEAGNLGFNKAGLSPAALAAAAKMFDGFTPLGAHPNVRISRGEKFAAFCREILRQRFIACPCPWTGTILQSRTSVSCPSVPWPSVSTYGYRFAGRDVFWLLLKGNVDCAVVGIYIPTTETVVTITENDHGGVLASARQFRTCLLSNHKCITDYLARPEQTRRTAILVNNYHFAHNLWNELSCIDYLNDDIVKHDVLIQESACPNGRLADLFPGIAPQNIVAEFTSFDEQHRKVLEHNGFLIPIGRRFIPRRLVDAISTVAKKMAPHAEAERDSFAAEKDFIIWISIRSSVRVWLNQIEGVIDILKYCAARWDNIGVIFDGYTPGYGGGAPQEELEKEQAIVKTIVDSLTAARCAVPYVSLVGADLQQAYVWGASADFYIANHGTIQHKIGWLHEIDGIAHTCELESFNPKKYTPMYVREGGRPATYVLGKPCRDDSHPGDARTNLYSYTLDPELIIAAMERMDWTTRAAQLAGRASAGQRVRWSVVGWALVRLRALARWHSGRQ